MKLQKGAFLGVSTSQVPDALRQHLGLQEGVGLVVELVEKDSPAEKAGLKKYDILNKLDDQILINGQQLAVLIRAHKSSDSVKLTITRGGKQQTVSATLVEGNVKPLDQLGFWEGGEPGQGQFRTGRLEGPGGFQNWNGAGQPRFNEWDLSLNGAKDKQNAKQKVKSKGGDKVTGDKVTMVFSDDEYQLILTAPGGDVKNRHLTAVDKKSGKTVFDGDLGDEAARDKLPPPVAERLKQLDEAGKTNPKSAKNEHQAGNRVEKRFDVKLNGPGKQPYVEEDKDEDKNPERDHDADNENDNDNNGDNDGNARPAEKPSADADETIRQGDVLKLYIADLQGPGVDTIKLARVRGGEVSLPYVGKVKAEGLTENQLERKIVKTYADAKLLGSANVTVKRVPAGDAETEPVEP